MINKYLILGIGSIAAISGYIFMSDSDNNPIKDKTTITNVVESKDIKIHKTKKIKILYIEEDTQEIKKIAIVPTKKDTLKEYNQESKVEIEELNSEEIIQYIQDNNLVDVTPLKTNQEYDTPSRFSVYADITIEEAKEMYDNTLPPPAPAIINNIDYPIIMDGYLNAMAKTKIVTQNDTNGEPVSAQDLESKEDEQSNTDTSDSFTIAPPSIGQN